jgi:ABC-type dipeptide/oligopeptide/nickel transport system ATPase subunit
MKFDIKYKNSFRNESVIGQFDLGDHTTIEFKSDYEIPKDFKSGLIVGDSGSGKTSLARLYFNFKENDYSKSDCSILDIFDSKLSTLEITNALTIVGLGVPKLWLNSYANLSNGQKARFDIAYRLLTDEIVVIDEFTSLVDRDVAKTMCLLMNKLSTKQDKKIVLVTCHHDVIDYLETDFIIDCDKQELTTVKKKDYQSKSSSRNVIEVPGNIIKSFTI